MNELTVKKLNLPVKIKDLTKFVLIGREKLISVRAEIRAIEKIGLAQEVREQKRDEAQSLAGALLDAETRIGELLKELPIGERRHTSSGGSIPKLPEGISHKQSHFFQALANNKDIVEKVKQEAVENDDLPTRTEVLRQIKIIKHEQNILNIKEKIKNENKTIKGLFDVLVIDPPWNYGREFDPDSSRVANPYPEMNFEEIKNIKIPAKKNAVLWLWATHSFIQDAFFLLKAWNFEYKCILTWDKQKMGMGSWLRLQTEFCLIGIRGKIIFNNKATRDIISEPRREHSRKPDEFYKIVEKLCNGKKIDYFSREKRKGWKTFGVENDKF